MNPITLHKKQIYDKGFFGLYFKVNSRYGIKIYKKNGTLNKRINLNTAKNKKIIQEATIGKLYKNFTKELVIAKYKNKYFLGIKQKHIRGSFNKEVDILKVKKDLSKKLIIHGDLNYKNVICNRTGYNVIDFDPNFATFVGEKRIYYIEKNKLIKKLKSSI